MRKIIFAGLIFLLASEVMAATFIELPPPRLKSDASLEQSIFSRRSTRDYSENDITMEQLSQILWAAQGITDSEFQFRAAPSAGALYPLHIYIAKKDGFYRYIPEGHKLLEIATDDFRPALVRASLGQEAIRQAPACVVISANFKITQAKFGPRAFRYVCMEIGHVAENIQLQATALGLASSPIGSFWDDVIKKSLDLPENEDPLYLIPVGYQQNNAE